MTVISDQMPEMVTRQSPTFIQRLMCLCGMHEWTSRVDLGGKPDSNMIKANPVGYFFEWAAPVCRHCPKQLLPRNF